MQMLGSKDVAALLATYVVDIHRRAEREGWKFKPRAGQGGGKDWIIASMPKATREAIATAMLAQGLSADLEASAQAPQESSLADLTEHQRRTALARLVIVKEIERTAALIGKKDKAVLLFLEAVKSGTLASHVAELVPVANDKYGDGKKQSISRETLYRWKKQYAEEGVLALAPLHRTKDVTVPVWAKAFLAEYQQPQKPSARDAYKRFVETYPSPPSLDQVYYWLKKMSVPARESGRVTGNALLKLRKHKRRLTDEYWPGDIYTADGTTFDAEIQHPIHGQPWKPEATFMIDVATRRCVGISLGDAESGFVVLDALRMACCFGGIPCYLYVDNGSGYKNKMMTGEGLGERVVRDMKAHGYSITNKSYESTVSVSRVDIEDDQVGIFKPLFGEMGRAAKVFPDEQVFGLLAQGNALSCYDGQNFFDTDHPVYPNVDGTGVPVSVSNYADGAGPAWYLLDDSRSLKPIIFQERTKPELTFMTDLHDEAVFMKDEFRFGIRYRCNAGFGFWQLAYCSRQPLTSENFNAAYAAVSSYKADGGRPLGIKPTLLVVPPTLRVKAHEVALTDRMANGADNPNKGLCEVLVTPWLG